MGYGWDVLTCLGGLFSCLTVWKRYLLIFYILFGGEYSSTLLSDFMPWGVSWGEYLNCLLCFTASNSEQRRSSHLQVTQNEISEESYPIRKYSGDPTNERKAVFIRPLPCALSIVIIPPLLSPTRPLQLLRVLILVQEKDVSVLPGLLWWCRSHVLHELARIGKVDRGSLSSLSGREGF